jgi:hypothetical protein
MEIIRAAAKVAKEEDKECVTMKHFDAVKAQFVEPKKLKAAATQPDLPTSAPGSTPVAAKPEADTNTTEDEPEAVVEDNAKPVKVPHVAPVQSLADLGADAETVNKKKLEKYRKQIIEAIAGWDAGPDPDKDAQVAFEDSQIESLADAICKVAQPF